MVAILFRAWFCKKIEKKFGKDLDGEKKDSIFAVTFAGNFGVGGSETEKIVLRNIEVTKQQVRVLGTRV